MIPAATLLLLGIFQIKLIHDHFLDNNETTVLAKCFIDNMANSFILLPYGNSAAAVEKSMKPPQKMKHTSYLLI